MDTRYFLSFPGSDAPRQPIDPVTCAVVLRFELLEPEEGDLLPSWTATNESGSGTVVDSHAAVYSCETLDAVVAKLARAGFKHVAIDMTSAPQEKRPEPTEGPIPF